jgi:hypothetical protein
MENGFQPDYLDHMVYGATLAVRKEYVAACKRLGQTPRQLSPLIVGMRSVRPLENNHDV